MSHRNEIMESPWSAAEPEGAVENPAEVLFAVGDMGQTPIQTKAGEPPSSKIYGVIEEVTAAGTRRWRVNMVRRGQLFAKTFSEKRFGGPEGAKAAALAYRDEVVRQYPMVSKREYHVLRRSSTTSGIPGVYLLASQVPPKWMASIQYADGRRVGKTFCTNKYGFEAAREMAIQARRRMLDDVVDQKTIRATNEIVQTLAPDLPVDDVLVMPSMAEYPRPVHTPSTDVPGVFLNKQPHKDKHGQEVIRHVWVAEYRWPDKKIRRVTFSESRYGAEQAKQMALDQHAAWQINPPDRVVPGAPRKVAVGRKPVSEVQRLVVKRKTKAGIVESASWIVQYRWSEDGRVQQAAFAVERYGEDEALRLATLQRQQWLQTPPEKEARKRGAPPKRRAYTDNNPMEGVCCFTAKSQAKFDLGSQRKYWMAEYKCADGRKLRRLFPEHTYGAEQARQLAIEQRQQWDLSPPDARKESDAKD